MTAMTELTNVRALLVAIGLLAQTAVSVWAAGEGEKEKAGKVQIWWGGAAGL